MDNLNISVRDKSRLENLRPRAALIDMDGTLYDSMPHHADAWTRMAREVGLEATREEIFMYEGRTGASTINMMMNRSRHRDATPEEIKELYGRKSRYFVELGPVEPMPGAADMLDALIHAGIKRVLVTGSGQNSLLSRLDIDFPGAFRSELRITAANVTHGKPHPEPYLKAMEMAMVEPHQAIAIENAPMGVESAARSGAFTIAVTTGPIPRQAMIDAGADLVVDSMPEFAILLPKLLYRVNNP